MIFYKTWQKHHKQNKGSFTVEVEYYCPCRSDPPTLELEAIDTNSSALMSPEQAIYLRREYKPVLENKLAIYRPFSCGLILTALVQDRFDTDPRPRTRSTGSSESFERLNGLLHTCTTEHDESNRYRADQARKRKLPTRLVDVDQCFDDNIVRVIESKNLSVDIPYMTLSHRWGSDSGYSLTKASYRSFQGDIRLYSLPLNFREACITTKRLGCRSIWTDFLCIYQESELDWLREASRMADIYAMSLLTIAASASSNTQQGLFRNRQYHAGRHACIQFSCSCDSTWLSSSTYGGMSWGDDDLPLHNRGWVLQEMALSCCVAFFTGSGVNWSCLSVDADELRQTPVNYRAYPQGLASSELHTLRMRSVNRVRPVTKSLLVPGCQLSDADWWTWEALLANYTHNELAFFEDKLIALAGIARNFKFNDPHNLGQYCAGMWEKELPWALLWHRHTDLHRDEPNPWPSSRYPSPTWSWASVDGALEWAIMSPTAQCLIDIVSVDINLALSSDPFGAVKGGRLRIKAHLVPCPSNLDLMGRSMKDGAVLWTIKELFLSRLSMLDLIGLDNLKRAFLAGLTTLIEQAHMKRKATSWAAFWNRLVSDWNFYRLSNLVLDEPCRIRSGHAFFMPIWDMPYPRASLRGKDLRTLRGIVLERTAASPWTYRRLGYLETEDSGWDWRDAVDEALLPDNTHLGKLEDGRYVIDLV